MMTFDDGCRSEELKSEQLAKPSFESVVTSMFDTTENACSVSLNEIASISEQLIGINAYLIVDFSDQVKDDIIVETLLYVNDIQLELVDSLGQE